jgi:hypothetical protein
MQPTVQAQVRLNFSRPPSVVATSVAAATAVRSGAAAATEATSALRRRVARAGVCRLPWLV